MQAKIAKGLQLGVFISLAGHFMLAGIQGDLAQNDISKKLVIGAWGAGFFSDFFGVINSLAWCEKNNITPIVMWDNHSLYFSPGGYNESKNCWEYYFEPVSTETYDMNYPFHDRYAAPDGSEFVSDSITISKNKEHRKRVNDIIKKYIKIKSCTMQKIESFYKEEMAGKKVIGVHIRGTDKSSEMKAISLEIILCKANEISQRYPGCEFFVATDEESILERAKTLLAGKVVYYNSQRSSNGKPLHFSEHNRAILGEEVLVETYLLSRCDFLIHTRSNVSSAVLFLNPEMENLMVYWDKESLQEASPFGAAKLLSCI